MSKRVKIAVIREATLNAKPTDTHYLAEGGLQIPRRDARALKGTTLYYEVLVDLGEVKGFDFIPGRDVPVYLTDSEPVLALDPQALSLVDWADQIVDIPATHMSFTHTVDQSILMQNAVKTIHEAAASVPGESSVDVTTSAEVHPDGTPQTVAVSVKITPEAPVKRKPGRPKKVVAGEPVLEKEVTLYPISTSELDGEKAATGPIEVAFSFQPDFVVTDKQDDESTFLIEPNGAAPTPAPSKPEFSFEVDEDEAPPPPTRNAAPQNLGFEVEEEETPAAAKPAAVPAEKPAPIVTASSTDDFTDVEPGLFDE